MLGRISSPPTASAPCVESPVASIRVRQTLRLLGCLLAFTAQVFAAAGQSPKDVEDSAKQGKFQQAFAQCQSVLAATPSADDLSRLRTLFSKYPGIQESGVASTGKLTDAAQTEQDLLRGQLEILAFARCVKSRLCDPVALAALQTRFVAAASRLILGAGIPVTFESNLLADWTASTGSELDKALERRIYQNTMANIAARDPRDTPSVMMADRLFRYLLREPEARDEAFASLERVVWRWEDLDGPLAEVYPELVKRRRGDPGLTKDGTPPQSATGQFGEGLTLDTKGVEFGPWVRRFLRQVRTNWDVPAAATSQRGRVSVSFNVHKDGTITDIAVVAPCSVEAFNAASYKAVAASNPTVPLPPEYPDDKALLTLTFYYNESPPQK